MTTARDGNRPDRRPDWLRRKHGHAPPRPRSILDLWADKIVQILDGVQAGQHTTPWPDQARADEARKALNRAARRAGISVGAYLADPDTGRCANCERMHCQPSTKGQLVLHVNTFTKKDAYAYMLDRYGPDTSSWPYIPGGRPPAGPGPADSAARPAAAKEGASCPHCHRSWRVPAGWQRFTCPNCKNLVERHAEPGRTRQRASSGRQSEPDEPSARPRLTGGAPRTAAKPQQKTRTEQDTKTGQPAQQQEREPLLTRIRQSLA
jgi:hypothetical protein